MPDEIDPNSNSESALPEGKPQEPSVCVSNVDAPPLIFDPPKRSVRMWKPEGEEFSLDHDYAQLIVDLGETDMGVVEFDHVYEPKGDQPGHTLIASVKVHSQE